MRTCAACGRTYEHLEGMVGDLDYCHPSDSTGVTCYMRASGVSPGIQVDLVPLDLVARRLGVDLSGEEQ